MARTLSSQELSAWTSGSAVYWVRAVVNDGSTDRELNALRDSTDDWILSLSYQDSVDAQMATATLTCKLKEGYYNLAPLDTASPFNASPHSTLLALGNTIKIYTATLPYGVFPVSGDWNFVFDGYIEEVTVDNAETITIMCHDLTEDLTTAFVQKVTTYSVANADTFQTVMQDILNDWGGSVTLNTDYVGAAPTAVVKEYDQRREPVYSALKTIADQIGYAVRYQFDSGTNTFKLYIIEPDRTASLGSNWTISQANWHKLSMSTSRKDVRNLINVVYYNGGSADARETASATDAASVAAYGTRWMELAEDISSQINTSTEATALATACLNDLKEPTAFVSCTINYLYALEIRDYVTLTADNIHFSANQSLALDAVSHTISNGGIGVSAMKLSGKPKLGRDTWKRKQAMQSYHKLAKRNMAFTVGQSVNLCSNGNFDESDF